MMHLVLNGMRQVWSWWTGQRWFGVAYAPIPVRVRPMVRRRR